MDSRMVEELLVRVDGRVALGRHCFWMWNMFQVYRSFFAVLAETRMKCPRKCRGEGVGLR